MAAFDFIKDKLAAQKAGALYRQRNCIEAIDGSQIKVDGKWYLNFSGNDYLGLSQTSALKQAMQEGVDRFGACSTGSSLLTGYHYAHQALENTLCQWLNKPHCILFASGFGANHGVLQALGQKDSYLWLDKLSHASLIDGALDSKAQVKRFLHNNGEQLQKFLSKNPSADKLVVSEGVFSMDGDSANLSELAAICQQHQAWLYLDDAHSVGVIGEQGQGSSSQIKPDIVMATFGKAIATSGAVVACDKDVFDYLTNFSRHYIYSTAISPALAWATKASIEMIQREQWRRDKIVELSALFKKQLSDEVTILPTESSIHALIIGDEEKTMAIAEQLKNRGIWLSAIRPPTVPKGTSRLRVTVCAHHSANDINVLAKNINEVLINAR